MRELADAIAGIAPEIHAIRPAVADGSGRIVAVARELDDCREQLERLAAYLEERARGRPPASASGRPGRPARRGGPERHLTSGRAPSTDDVGALLVDVAASLPPTAANRCRERIGLASQAELTILSDLVEEGLTHEQLVSLLEGGHLLVPGHALLEKWSTLEGVHPRTSSHYHPRDAEVGVHGPEWFRHHARASPTCTPRPSSGSSTA